MYVNVSYITNSMEHALFSGVLQNMAISTSGYLEGTCLWGYTIYICYVGYQARFFFADVWAGTLSRNEWKGAVIACGGETEGEESPSSSDCLTKNPSSHSEEVPGGRRGGNGPNVQRRCRKTTTAWHERPLSLYCAVLYRLLS